MSILTIKLISIAGHVCRIAEFQARRHEACRFGEEAHARGLIVLVYAMNDAAGMRAESAMGWIGFYAEAVQVLAEGEIRLF